MAIETKKTRVNMNKSIYLAMSILDISKTLLYEFRYDYIKPKYQDKAKQCYTDTDSFIIQIKTEDFYKDIANNVEKSLTHLTMTKVIKDCFQQVKIKK